MASREAKRRLHFRRPNHILPFNLPSRDDPHQLPGVRATHAAGIVPCLASCEKIKDLSPQRHRDTEKRRNYEAEAETPVASGVTF